MKFSTSSSIVLLCVLSLCFPSASPAADPVQAEIGKETAWTGEAVPLIITLYSPGPFSGTASFDLPELPGTAFLKMGNPLVGSEEIEDESYFTQRHEFALYTQRSGEIVLPAFRIRFAGKRTFTSDPEPMEGATPELRFQSKRPPGTESMDVVVSAAAMEVRQTWNPEPSRELKAGDVLVRTVIRDAQGTTAMMLPPVSTDAEEAVQVYLGAPDVQDKIERGDARATRTDTVKYQFQQAGSFTLPELSFVWWDPEQEKLQSEVLPGLTIQVVQASVPAPPKGESESIPPSVWTRAIIGLLAFGLFAWLVRKPLARWVATWQAYHNRPEAHAARKLRSACAANDASAAYTALMAWYNAMRIEGGGSCLKLEQHRELHEQCQALSQHLFAVEVEATSWNGERLWATFCQSRRRRNRNARQPQPSALPALNPIRSRD